MSADSRPVARPVVVAPRPAAGAEAGLTRLAGTLPWLLPLVVAAALFAMYVRAQPHWLADPDAQDYAQLGRQLAAGRGPVTAFMPWNGLDYLTRRPGPADVPPVVGASEPWPNIVRFPLTPVLMALSFVVLGVSDAAVHLPGGLAYVLTAAVAGLLGARVYGAWAGLAAGLATAAFPVLVNYSLTGLTEPTLGLLLLAALACVAPRRTSRGGDERAGPAVGAGLLLLGGLLFGLAMLNRYDSALLLLPIVSLWLLPHPDWRRAVMLFGVAAVVMVLPWSAYLTVVAGTPLFNLQPASIAAQASGRAGGLGWYWPEYVRPLDVWLEQPSRSLATMAQELQATPNHLRKLLGWSWGVAGAAACLLAIGRFAVASWRHDPSGGIGGGRLALFLIAAVLLRALLASILGLNLQRHFVSLVPLLLVIVAGEADWLVRGSVRRWSGARRLRAAALGAARAGVAGLLVVPSLWTIGPYLLPPTAPHERPTRNAEVELRPENQRRLAELVGRDRLVASNVPWSVAWEADRRAVPLPPTVEQTPELERRFGISVDAIYLADRVSLADAPRSWRTWEELRRQGTPPPGYVLAEAFPNGAQLFLKAP